MNINKMCPSNQNQEDDSIQNKINYIESCKGVSVSSLITLITPANYSI